MKTITIRVTEEERDLITRAADPEYPSHWLRKLALDSGAVRALLETPKTEEEVFECLDRLSTSAEFFAKKLEADKRAEIADQLLRFKNSLLSLVARHQREQEEWLARWNRSQQSVDALQAKLAEVTQQLAQRSP